MLPGNVIVYELIMLVHDAPGVPRRVVWAESAANVFTRLTDMLTFPQESPELSRWLEKPARLRSRVAVAFDTAALRRGLAEAVREKERDAALSGGCCR